LLHLKFPKKVKENYVLKNIKFSYDSLRVEGKSVVTLLKKAEMKVFCPIFEQYNHYLRISFCKICCSLGVFFIKNNSNGLTGPVFLPDGTVNSGQNNKS